MICSNCGTNINDTDKFCSKCGTQVAPSSKGNNLTDETAQVSDSKSTQTMKKPGETSNTEKTNEGFLEYCLRVTNVEGYGALPISEKWRIVYTDGPKRQKVNMICSIFTVLLFGILFIGAGVEKIVKNSRQLEKTEITTSTVSTQLATENPSRKTIYEWAAVLKGTNRDAVVRVLGKPDYAQEDGKVAGGAVRFIQYVYQDKVENEHTGKLDNLYITFDWNSTRKISAGATGTELDLMFPGY